MKKSHTETDERKQFGEEAASSEKYCSVTNPRNALQVSYAENLKQPIKRLQTCESFDSQIIAEYFTQGHQSLLERLYNYISHDPFKHEILRPPDRMTDSFVSDYSSNHGKKELSEKKVPVTEK